MLFIRKECGECICVKPDACLQEIAKAKKLTHPVIWQEIHGNVYTYKRRKSWKEDDIAICQCQPIAGQGCLDNCINRMLNIECTQVDSGRSDRGRFVHLGILSMRRGVHESAFHSTTACHS